jgi:hypothetical protein
MLQPHPEEQGSSNGATAPHGATLLFSARSRGRRSTWYCNSVRLYLAKEAAGICLHPKLQRTTWTTHRSLSPVLSVTLILDASLNLLDAKLLQQRSPGPGSGWLRRVRTLPEAERFQTGLHLKLCLTALGHLGPLADPLMATALMHVNLTCSRRHGLAP